MCINITRSCKSCNISTSWFSLCERGEKGVICVNKKLLETTGLSWSVKMHSSRT